MSSENAKERDDLKAIFDAHLRPSKGSKRTPNEVTSDRLGDFLDKYGELLTGDQRDAVALVRHLLETADSNPS